MSWLCLLVILSFALVTHQQVCAKHCKTDSDCNDPKAQCKWCEYGLCAPRFQCPPLPKFPKATDVRHLRPQDISVVMTVGDSISAGFAMTSGPIVEPKNISVLEYRGGVFSIGGDEGQITVPNFLKVYNPELQGWSVNYSLPIDYIDYNHHHLAPYGPEAHLNAAQSGGEIADTPGQLNYIVKQLQTAYKNKVDFHNDWKLFTFYMGANNLCGVCGNHSDSSPEYFRQALHGVMNLTASTIPRVFMNVLAMFNMSRVWDVHEQSLYCRGMWSTICKSECGCITGGTAQDRALVDIAVVAYNKVIAEVVAEWQAKNIPGFYPVYQPFLENTIVNDPDFMSGLDCFHPSRTANAGFAIGLWNNMLSPPARKVHEMSRDDMTILCPTADSYLQ